MYSSTSRICQQFKLLFISSTKSTQTRRQVVSYDQLIGIPRNIHQPLPYIALLIELGAESQITASSSPLKDDDVFESLREERESAVNNLNEYKAKKVTKTGLTKQGDRARDARQRRSRMPRRE